MTEPTALDAETLLSKHLGLLMQGRESAFERLVKNAALEHQSIGIGAKHMKLANGGIAVFLKPLAHIRGHRLILEPGANVGTRAISA